MPDEYENLRKKWSDYVRLSDVEEQLLQDMAFSGMSCADVVRAAREEGHVLHARFNWRSSIQDLWRFASILLFIVETYRVLGDHLRQVQDNIAFQHAFLMKLQKSKNVACTVQELVRSAACSITLYEKLKEHGLLTDTYTITPHSILTSRVRFIRSLFPRAYRDGVRARRDAEKREKERIAAREAKRLEDIKAYAARRAAQARAQSTACRIRNEQKYASFLDTLSDTSEHAVLSRMLYGEVVDSTDPQTLLEQKELVHEVSACIKSLLPYEQKILRLRAEECSSAEIALIMGLKTGTVRRYMGYITEQLRRSLRAHRSSPVDVDGVAASWVLYG